MALFAFLDTAEVHHGGLQLLVLLTAVVTVIGALLMLVVARRLRYSSQSERAQRCSLQLELCAERGRALAVAHHCLRRVRESAHSQR